MLPADPNSEVIYIVIIGTAGTLLITISLVLFIISYQKRNLQNRLKLQELEIKHQQELTEVSFQGQEKERQRIAGDLHDDVGSMLSAAKLQMNLIRMKSKDSPELTPLIKESLEIISSTIGEVRSISRNLSPYLLDSLGFSKAIEYLVKRINSPGELTAEFVESGKGFDLSEKTGINIYRAVQELINNVIRHSGADNLILKINWQADRLLIDIRDNGTGFDYEKMLNSAEQGLGLMNIRSRINIAGAQMELESSEKGTHVIITYIKA